MGKSHVKAKKRKIDGHIFDSGDEADFYEHLKSRDDVHDIILQPQFVFMPEFKISCGRCKGEGKKPSPKTGNPIKCQRCDGIGDINRQPWTYRADFEVEYADGYREIIDVKGGWKDKRFPLVRKMFEYQQGYELIVIKKKKGDWVRV